MLSYWRTMQRCIAVAALLVTTAASSDEKILQREILSKEEGGRRGVPSLEHVSPLFEGGSILLDADPAVLGLWSSLSFTAEQHPLKTKLFHDVITALDQDGPSVGSSSRSRTWWSTDTPDSLLLVPPVFGAASTFDEWLLRPDVQELLRMTTTTASSIPVKAEEDLEEVERLWSHLAWHASRNADGLESFESMWDVDVSIPSSLWYPSSAYKDGSYFDSSYLTEVHYTEEEEEDDALISEMLEMFDYDLILEPQQEEEQREQQQHRDSVQKLMKEGSNAREQPADETQIERRSLAALEPQSFLGQEEDTSEEGRRLQLGGRADTCHYESQWTDRRIFFLINYFCPCTGPEGDGWDGRATYLHGCVELVLRNWVNRGIIAGQKALYWWYRGFKYRYYLENDCGVCGPVCPVMQLDRVNSNPRV